MRNNEKTTKMYKKVQKLNRPHLSNGGLSHVLTQDSHGNLTRIDDIPTMNEALFHRNRKHFAQADGTPCTQPIIQDHIGTSGITKGAQDIINNVIPPDLPVNIRLLFEELQSNVPPISPHYSFEDMIYGFATWREKTTTSPSGKHLGMYKALVNAHKFTLKTPSDELNATQSAPKDLFATKVLQLQNCIINTAIKHHHTLDRWKIVHNFFL